jgi:hypothetical protein
VLKGSPRIDREEYENDVLSEMEAAQAFVAPTPAYTAPAATSSEDTYSYFDSLANEEF